MEQGPRKGRRGCGYGCLVFFVFLLAVLFVAWFGARAYVRRGMTPAQRAELDTFFGEPVEVPKRWQEVYQFPDAVVKAGEKVRAAWVPVENDVWVTAWRKLQAGEDLSPEEWNAVEEVLRTHQDFINAVKAFAATDGYELEAFPVVPPSGLPNLFEAHTGMELLCTEAHVHALEGNWGEGSDSFMTAVSLGRRHPASEMLVHVVAFDIVASTCISLGLMLPDCSDADALHRILTELNALKSEICLGVRGDPSLNWVVGPLRGYARAGLSVDLSTKGPRGYFYRQMIELDRKTGRPVCSWEKDPWPVALLVRLAPYSRTSAEGVYKIARPDLREFATRECTMQSRYDLARLRVAARIVELETGALPASATDLVPRFFEKEPLDPFVGKPYRWSASMGSAYGVGPDRTDDGAAVRYDPSNGTLSRGDIFFSILPKKVLDNAK